MKSPLDPISHHFPMVFLWFSKFWSQRSCFGPHRYQVTIHCLCVLCQGWPRRLASMTKRSQHVYIYRHNTLYFTCIHVYVYVNVYVYVFVYVYVNVYVYVYVMYCIYMYLIVSVYICVYCAENYYSYIAILYIYICIIMYCSYIYMILYVC